MTKYSEAMENIKVTDEMRSRILRNVALSLEKGKDEAEAETETEAEIEKEAETETEKETVKKTGETITADESADITEFRNTKKRRSGAWITPVALTAAAALILVIVRPWSGSSLMSEKNASSSFDAAMSEDAAADYHYDSETAVAETAEADSWDEDYPVYEDAMLEAEAAEEETKDNSEGIEGMVFDATEYSSAQELSDAVGFVIKDIETVPFEPTEVIYRVISGKLAEIVYIGDGEKLTVRKSAGDEDNSGDYNDYPVFEAAEIEDAKVNIMGYDDGFYLSTWYDGEYFHSIGSDNPQSSDKMKEMVSDVIAGERG